MTTLAELKRKYSGQTIPDWELARVGTVAEVAETVSAPEPKKRRRKEAQPTEPVTDGDSLAD